MSFKEKSRQARKPPKSNLNISDQGKPQHFSVGNIGSVGGDVFSGKKADRIIEANGARDVNVTDDDTPYSIKAILAVTGLVAALAGLVGALASLFL